MKPESISMNPENLLANRADESPEWIGNLIIYQLRIDTFTPEGTLKAAKEKLDYLNELGVTGLWLAPIYEAATEPAYQCCAGRFCNFDVKEPDRLNPMLGTDDDLIEFVAEAHLRGMKVMLEIVPHGVTFDSSLVANHPEWFQKEADGAVKGTWGMADFDWLVPELQNWWISMAKNWVLQFGIDGFRCDLEPGVSGHELWAKVKRACAEEGSPIVLFSEMKDELRTGAYDFEQVGIGDIHTTQGSGDFLYENDIVDVIKSGKGLSKGGSEPYYTFALSVHDSFVYRGRGSRLRFAYEMLLTPFIPIFFAGEEVNHPTVIGDAAETGVLFFNRLDWQLFEEERQEFRRDIQKMIAIRKLYSDFLAPDKHSIRETNIVDIPAQGSDLQVYSRYDNKSRAIVVIGNRGDASKWSFERGNWTVEYGELSQNRLEPSCSAMIPQSTWGDMEIEFRLTTLLTYDHSLDGWAGVQFHRQLEAEAMGSGSGYIVAWTANRKIMLIRDGEVICEAATLPSPQHSRKIRVKVNGSHIRVYIEGENLAVLDVIDDVYTSGAIGLISHQCHAHFGDFRIRQDKIVVFADDFKGEGKRIKLDIPLSKIGLGAFTGFDLTDLLTEEKEVGTNAEQLGNYEVSVAGNDVKLLLIEGLRDI